MTSKVRFFILSVLMSLLAAPLLADGLPPSQEDVCDFLHGSEYSPGLFGLCNAYCEAKDCDAYAEGEGPKACGKLYDNFVKKATGPNDPLEPPCLEEPSVECPCWTAESERYDDPGMGLPASMCFDEFPGLGTVAVYDDGFNLIAFAHRDTECEYSDSMLGILDVQATTPEENAVCLADVHALINDPEEGFGGLDACMP